MTTMDATGTQRTGARPGPRPAAGDSPANAPRDPEAVIAAARARIDELDGRIIALIKERMAVSAHVQRTRLAAGGRRVHLAREMEILRHYRESLGRPGTQLAMTLLELCRGR